MPEDSSSARHQVVASRAAAAFDTACDGFDARTEQVFEQRAETMSVAMAPTRSRCPDGFPEPGGDGGQVGCGYRRFR
jgi:hypothetical protein